MKYKKNPDMYVTTTCDNCKKEITRYKHKYKQSKTHFCSMNCYYQFKNRTVYSKTRIKINCHGCDKEISVYGYLYRQSKTKKFFCNKTCYENNRDKVVNRKSVYLTHYHCRSCGDYIKHEDAVRRYYSKHNEPLKNPYLVCPNSDCKNVRLSTKPHHSRRNEIFRMQLLAMNIQTKK